MTATLTDEAREKLQERLQEIDKHAAVIHEAMKPLDAKVEPFRNALAALESIKDGLIADAGVEVIGNCETCDGLLIEGDLGHRCNDGPILCEECSPTWSWLLNQYTEAGSHEAAADPEGFEMGLQAAKAHVDAGDGDKKHVLPL